MKQLISALLLLFPTLIALLLPLHTFAQKDVITFNEKDKQMMFCHINEQNNLETFTIIDTNDQNTICYDDEGRIKELTNSLGTLQFEYEEDCISAKYQVDGQLLSRHVYKYTEINECKQHAEAFKSWKGTLTTTDKVINFQNSNAFKKGYEYCKKVTEKLGNPIKALYEDVLRKAIYGEKKDMNGIDQAFDDLISVYLKAAVGVKKTVKNRVKEIVLKDPRKHWSSFVNVIHDFINESYQLNKSNNNYEMAWREGLKEKVLRNEITIEEASAKVAEVLAKKKKLRLEEKDPLEVSDTKEIIDYDADKDKITVKEINNGDSPNIPLEAKNAPSSGDVDLVWKGINSYVTSKNYGRLDYVTIYYHYYAGANNGKWLYQRQPSTEAGKIKLVHKSRDGGIDNNKLDYPFYKVELTYLNDYDYNNWGDVLVRLWLSPSGKVINTYIVDKRHKHSLTDPGANLKEPKISGSDWLNLNVVYY